MLGVIFGGMLNVLYGPRPQHYGIAIVSALFGGAISAQFIQEIAIPDPAYPEPSFGGLHLPAWAFLTFAGAIFIIALMLMNSPEFTAKADIALLPLNWFQRFALGLAIAIALANAVSAIRACGTTPCPDGPARYFHKS